MQWLSEETEQLSTDKSFTKPFTDNTMEVLKNQIHFDWAGIKEPLCNRPHAYCHLLSQNEAEITCPDCWEILQRKETNPDESISYYVEKNRTWDYDYLMGEPF